MIKLFRNILFWSLHKLFNCSPGNPYVSSPELTDNDKIWYWCLHQNCLETLILYSFISV